MAIVRHYNLKRVQCTIGSLRVDGWASGDVITLTSRGEGFTATESGDGSHVMISKDNNPIWDMTLVVKRNTAASRRLAAFQASQLEQADSGTVEPLALQIYDPASGTKFTERNLIFGKPPDVPFPMVDPPDATYNLILPSPTWTIDADVPLTT